MISRNLVGSLIGWVFCMGLLGCLVYEWMVGGPDGTGVLSVLFLMWLGGYFVSRGVSGVSFHALWGG